jgi:RNA polymerase II C-terminal domain phosphatase-like 3/4
VKRAGPTADPLSEAASRTFPCCLLGRRGKLCLVLDLDHTLLNSATFAEVGPALHEALDARAASEAATLPPDQRLLFRLDAIKVRGRRRPAAYRTLLS